MIARTLFGALVCFGFVACAGADTDVAAADEVAFTMADVEAAPDAWRAVDPQNLIIFETTKGQIVLELLPEVAPAHAEQFRNYVQQGLYDDTPFHRVLKDFMAQGGDIEQRRGAEVMLEPTAAEFTIRRKPSEMPLDTIGPADSARFGFYKGFPIQSQAQFLAELSFDGQVETWIPHCEGVLSTARLGEQPGISKERAENSGNAQFFLISGKGRHLDKDYTAKGRVIAGLDVVKAIKLGPPGDGFPIANPDVLKTARLAADLPEGERLQAFVQRTNTPEWAIRLAEADRQGSDICDLPAVPAVIG